MFSSMANKRSNSYHDQVHWSNDGYENSYRRDNYFSGRSMSNENQGEERSHERHRSCYSREIYRKQERSYGHEPSRQERCDRRHYAPHGHNRRYPGNDHRRHHKPRDNGRRHFNPRGYDRGHYNPQGYDRGHYNPHRYDRGERGEEGRRFASIEMQSNARRAYSPYNNDRQPAADPHHNNVAQRVKDDKPPWFNPEIPVRDCLRGKNICATELIVNFLCFNPLFYHKKTEKKFSKAQVSAMGMRYILHSLGLTNQDSPYYKHVFKRLQSFSSTNLFLIHALDHLDHGEFPKGLEELTEEAKLLKLMIIKNKERDLCPTLPK